MKYELFAIILAVAVAAPSCRSSRRVERTVTNQTSAVVVDSVSRRQVSQEELTEQSGREITESHVVRESGVYKIDYDSLGRVSAVSFERLTDARKNGRTAEKTVQQTNTLDSIAVSRNTESATVDTQASTEKTVEPAAESALFKIILIAAGALAGILFAIYLHRRK